MMPQNSKNKKALSEINIQFINAIQELKISSLLKQSNICKDSRSRNGNGRNAIMQKPEAETALIHSALEAGIEASCVLVDTYYKGKLLSLKELARHTG